MKNQDMPAMPNDMDTQSYSMIGGDNTFKELFRYRRGLTKLEHFAGLAMQGLLAKPEPEHRYGPHPPPLSVLAVSAALGLLEELEKQQ